MSKLQNDLRDLTAMFKAQHGQVKTNHQFRALCQLFDILKRNGLPPEVARAICARMKFEISEEAARYGVELTNLLEAYAICLVDLRDAFDDEFSVRDEQNVGNQMLMETASQLNLDI